MHEEWSESRWVLEIFLLTGLRYHREEELLQRLLLQEEQLPEGADLDESPVAARKGRWWRRQARSSEILRRV